MKTCKLADYCVNEFSTMQDAIAMIQKNESRCVIVIDSDHKVRGVFSQGDALRAILLDVDVHTPLKNLVKPSFLYLHSRDMRAAGGFFEDSHTLVPIVDKEFRLKGVITLPDFFRSWKRAH